MTSTSWLLSISPDAAFPSLWQPKPEIVDRGTWPPMPRSQALVATALGHATKLGLVAGEQLSGGVSDGSGGPA